MRKLLQIGVEVNSGSTGRITEEIGLLAQKSGFDSYIAYARGFNPSASKIIKIGNKFSMFSHLMKTRFLGEHLNGSYFATKIFINKIRKLDPDIIHLHQIHGYYINVPLLFNFLKDFKKPVIWTLHDCWAFTGHCSYFSLVSCDKWKKHCTNCPQFSKYPASLFIDKSFSEYSSKKILFNKIENLFLVGVSKWLSGLAKESFLMGKNIKTIYNGVNTNILYPRKNKLAILNKFNLNDGYSYVIAVGTTWSKSKGLNDYVELSKILRKDIKLLLVGLDSGLSKQLPKNIFCIERTESQSELAELYSASEILLCLSYQESFGLTPIEAMSCGTPVIAYDNTALNELIDDSTGIKITTGNVAEVNNAIEKMLSIGKVEFSESCVNRVKKIYDMEVTYKQYINLYNQIML